jgi:hypothetical protein
MLRRVRRLFNEYREYVRVDLAMYAVLILLIIIYFILATLDVV